MKDLIYVKTTPDKGLGVFALRDVGKDEILSESSPMTGNSNVHAARRVAAE